MNCTYHPEVPSSAFCQFCGKPLCKDCVRNVGGSVFCETCLTERLRGTGAGAATAPVFTGTPHPMLAALLGFIPGVGAMYNGQYAKAIAHVVIFAVLASLSDHAGIFGILVAAWVFYQVFDAYQTALARRDGLPLPNPFGLNDIAQRLGIHPHPGVPPVPPVPPAPGAAWEPVAGAGQPPYGQTGPTSAGFVPPAGAPGYVPGQDPNQPYPTLSYSALCGSALCGSAPIRVHAGPALSTDATISSAVCGTGYSDGCDCVDRTGHPVPLRLARIAAS